jgi:hypothetical protein
MSTAEKHSIFLAAEDAFESELVGAVAMAAAERLGSTSGPAAEAFVRDLLSLAAVERTDVAWERYGGPVVDAFLADLEEFRAEQRR